MSDLATLMEHWNAEKSWVVGEDLFFSHRLMFHYALLVNPSDAGYEYRYCYKNLALIEFAMEEYERTGKLRYWHKDHSANLSVVGNLLFPQGANYKDADQAVGSVDWTIKNKLEK